MKTKFILLLLIGFLFASCRSDDNNLTDNNNSNGNSNTINPPAWIKGKWKLQDGYESYYTFTNNDIIIQNAGMTTNLKPVADLGVYSQTSSDTEFTYSMSMSTLNIVTYTYKYKKVSSTKILTDLGLGGTPDFELIKQ